MPLLFSTVTERSKLRGVRYWYLTCILDLEYLFTTIYFSHSPFLMPSSLNSPYLYISLLLHPSRQTAKISSFFFAVIQSNWARLRKISSNNKTTQNPIFRKVSFRFSFYSILDQGWSRRSPGVKEPTRSIPLNFPHHFTKTYISFFTFFFLLQSLILGLIEEIISTPLHQNWKVYNYKEISTNFFFFILQTRLASGN